MQTIIDLILQSGETGINLALYILLPIMVVMMAFMRLLEDKGVLHRIAILLSPLLLVFGLPGLGVFAILQVLLVSFAAPIATLKIIDQDEEVSNRRTAATLAAIMSMSQANATFPLAAKGLNLPIIMVTSMVGGFIAAYIAFRLAKGEDSYKRVSIKEAFRYKNHSNTPFLNVLFKGGEEGVSVVAKALPALILALLVVNIFNELGIINYVETILTPYLARVGFPGISVLIIATKYFAGGTAMMAVTLDQIAAGTITALELNRIAGFTINPLDPVGVAVLIAAGPKVAAQVRPALIGAVSGILFRGIMHMVIFSSLFY